MSDNSQISFDIFYKTGTPRSRPNLGLAYVGLYDINDDIIASGELEFDGVLNFVANNIPDGNYYFVVSTDIDNDGYICSYGELCEFYPESTSSQTTLL